MAVNGKNKGNTFERTIANELSARFKEHLGIEKGFRRNPDSGSFFGGSNKARTETHDTEKATFGDIICPDTFRWCIECKNYKTPPSLNTIMLSDVKDWDKWLGQCRQDAANSDRKALLIVKYNLTEKIAFVDIKDSAELGLTPVITYKDSHIFRLDDLLKLKDAHFFSDAS